MNWTIASVKDELPQVKVKIGKQTHWARITGRLNPFATVTVFADDRKYLRGPAWVDFQFAWQTIADALNNDRPLSA